MAGHVFEGLHGRLERVLEGGLPRARDLDQLPDPLHVLLGVAGQLVEDLGPLVLGDDEAQLGDGVEVEELLHELLEELEHASQSGRFQILEKRKRALSRIVSVFPVWRAEKIAT